jgi:predicted ATPase
LVILDNCEHLLNTAAYIADRLTSANDGVRLLATSRSPLQIKGEVVYHVAPLAYAPAGADTEQILQSYATQLFLDRSSRSALDHDCMRHLESVAEICSRLDGIPLAIELAAARAAVLGVEAVAKRLDAMFDLLAGGAVDVLPRHQTLRAVFDWSFSLLSEAERALFRYCGVFNGGFSLEAAVYVMQGLTYSRADTVEALVGLIAKSLVVPDRRTAQRFRLLETTRAYATERLKQVGQYDAASRAHSEFMNVFFDSAVHQYARSIEFLTTHVVAELGNLRAAIAWCFAESGSHHLGIELASTAVPLLFDLSMLEECTEWSLMALEAIDRSNLQSFLPRTKLRLLSAYASGLAYSAGPGPEVVGAWTEALSLSVTYGDDDRELRAVWGLWNAEQYSGDSLAALRMARRFASLAELKGTKLQVALSHRILGIALHYVGAHERATERLQTALASEELKAERWDTTGIRVDQIAVTTATLARTLWFSGDKVAALRATLFAERAAKKTQHEMSTAYVLAEATIPLAILDNDEERSVEAVRELRTLSRRAGFNIWLDACDAFECAARTSSGSSSPKHIVDFQNALSRMLTSKYLAPLPLVYLKLAAAHHFQGDDRAAMAVLEEAELHCKQRGTRWLSSELSKLKKSIQSRKIQRANSGGLGISSA